jgi:hypothetical protein
VVDHVLWRVPIDEAHHMQGCVVDRVPSCVREALSEAVTEFGVMVKLLLVAGSSCSEEGEEQFETHEASGPLIRCCVWVNGVCYCIGHVGSRDAVGLVKKFGVRREEDACAPGLSPTVLPIRIVDSSERLQIPAAQGQRVTAWLGSGHGRSCLRS